MNVPPVSFERTLTLPGNVSKLIFSCYLIKKKSLEVIEQTQLSLQTTKKTLKSVEMSNKCLLTAHVKDDRLRSRENAEWEGETLASTCLITKTEPRPN